MHLNTDRYCVRLILTNEEIRVRFACRIIFQNLAQLTSRLINNTNCAISQVNSHSYSLVTKSQTVYTSLSGFIKNASSFISIHYSLFLFKNLFPFYGDTMQFELWKFIICTRNMILSMYQFLARSLNCFVWSVARALVPLWCNRARIYLQPGMMKIEHI